MRWNVQGSTLVFFAPFLFGLTVFADLPVQGDGCHRQDHPDLFELDPERLLIAGWRTRAEHKQLVAQLREVDERRRGGGARPKRTAAEQSKARERLLEREEAQLAHENVGNTIESEAR